MAVFLVALVAGGMGAGYLFGTTGQRIGTTITSTTTRIFTVQTSQPYMIEPATYTNLGYPKVTYPDYSPYLPGKPNYTLEYQIKVSNSQVTSFQIGPVGGDTISLDQAVGIAANFAKLTPANFSLTEADFSPGTIINKTLVVHPLWELFFARDYHGYWPFGCAGNGAFSVEVNLDAFDGSIYPSGQIPPGCTFPTPNSILPTSAQLELNTNSSAALGAIRDSNLVDVPRELSANGVVTFMQPRLVLFGSNSNNEAFMNPINASLSGHYSLCWVIELYSPTPNYGYQGTFAVNAQTGQLLSGWAQVLFPSIHYEYVGLGSTVYSSARNINVSTEMFEIDGGIVGVSGHVPVAVPNVVIAKPGSRGTIELNFSSTIDSAAKANLSFVNPFSSFQSLPSNGLPIGVTIVPSSSSIVIPSKGQAPVELTIKVDQSAPAGTYLIGLKITMLASNWGQPSEGVSVIFVLSIWNGAGQWPAPPVPG